jgi:N-acetylglutamate synthase-like GNAT family acetyltransferase
MIESCFTELELGGHTEEGKRLQIAGNQPDQLIGRSKTTTYFVATIDGSIVGICGHGGGKVRTLFVDISHHRRGIGTALLTRVLADAKRCGLTQICAWSTIHAQPLYASLGFEKKRQVFLPEGASDIILIEMSKDL